MDDLYIYIQEYLNKTFWNSCIRRFVFFFVLKSLTKFSCKLSLVS